MDIGSLVSIVIYLIVIGCIFGLLYYLLNILPIPEPIKSFVRIALIVLIVLVLIFWLLSIVGGGPVVHIGRLHM
jgi:hypothetical protein